jgi:hypothetical protein
VTAIAVFGNQASKKLLIDDIFYWNDFRLA